MAKQYTVKELASKVDKISKTLHTDLKNIKEEIYNSISFHFSALKLAHINIRSLFAKFHNFRELVTGEDYDVVAISETWLHENITNSMISIPAYKFLRMDNHAEEELILEDLQYRLTNHIPFQPNLEGVVESYGMNAELLNSIVEFWKNKYNWREREIFLNQFPHYMVNIQGLDIHYIHVKPKKTKGIKVLPLLISHGWPGSVREFYDIIPMLTTPQKDKKFVFEVIAPSIPGYGFSEAPNRPGLHIFHIANIFKNLMKKIGFEKFYVQGGDWGGAITQTMAAMYPEHVIGMHSNWCLILSPLQFTKTMIGSYFPSLIGIPKEQEKYLYPQSEKISMLILESGYFHLQATKPDTVGVALRDSPVGLAAYMLEKFIRKGSKHWEELYDGVSPKKYTDLLDNVMIYWVTRSMTTSMRLYAEYMTSSKLGLNRIPVEVPSGCARFTRELTFHPDVILKDRYLNLVHVADYEGGHFAALELPKILAKDIFTFVEKVENLKTL